MRRTYGGKGEPCECVLRAVFRVGWSHLQYCCSSQGPRATPVDANHESRWRPTFGLKAAEYVADFCAVTERALTQSEFELFRLHYQLGFDSRSCCGKLHLPDDAAFYRAKYRIEQKLGRAFRELEPYPLYPLEDYFSDGRSEPLPRAA